MNFSTKWGSSAFYRQSPQCSFRKTDSSLRPGIMEPQARHYRRPAALELFEAPAPNDFLVSETGTLKTDTASHRMHRSQGVKVSVDLSQILACGAPIEEIVLGHPYSSADPANSRFSSPFTHCRYFVLCSSSPHSNLVLYQTSLPSSFIMYLSLLPVSLLLSLATAATTISGPSASSTACAAQPVMDSCYASTSAIAQACATTDYGCLCSKWNDVLTYAAASHFLISC